MALTTQQTPGGDGPPALRLDEPALVSEPQQEVLTVEAPDQAFEVPQETAADRLWWMAAVLWARKWTIVVLVTLSTIAAIAYALYLPNEYLAETRVLIPPAGGTSMMGMLEQVAPGASSLLGSKGGDYTRYLSILSSRTVMERTVERFNLEEAYEVTDAQDPRASAIRELTRRATFQVALDYDYLAIQVLDQNAPRAAQISGYLVSELNKENTRLAISNASEERGFIEKRLQEAETALATAQTALQRFQERNGVVDVENQSLALFQAIAESRAQIARLEIERESLRQQYGDNNPDVESIQASIDVAKRQLADLIGGQDALLPVPQSRLPQLGRRYTELFQELTTQAKIIEFIRPIYEQARFDEQRQVSAVQILDVATVPKVKAGPRRSVIVIAAALTSLIVASLLILIFNYVKNNFGYIKRRLSVVR